MVAGAPAQSPKPAWCRALPRPQYKSLQRVAVNDTWFEVYRVAPRVFAIYEPHQSEEAISFLIVGDNRALLWDTGLGIGNLKGVTAELTRLPVAVLNSHTHDDHVGDNWQFDTIYSMDTAFSLRNAQGSREDAQAEIQPGQVCGQLPAGFDAEAYATRPGELRRSCTTANGSIWAAGACRLWPRRVTRPTPSRCSTRAMHCCSPAIPTIPERSGCIGRKPIWQRTTAPYDDWRRWLRR